jgi:hypothetical protein
LKTKARELSVGDLMDVLVLRAAKASERAPNAAEAAEVPAEAAANGVVVAGVFDLYIHNIYIYIYMCYVSDVFCLSAYFYRCG